jgi:PAS domain S-box-containing protein
VRGTEPVEQRYRLLFERHPLPMWVYDVATLRFLEVNDAAVRHYGYTREEFLGMTILDIRPVDDVQLIVNVTLHPQRKGATHNQLWRHRRKDGRVFWVEITSEEVRFQGRPAEVVIAIEAMPSDEYETDQPAAFAP